MSVWIKGMEMPECCGKCSCVEISKYLHLCGVTGNSLDDEWDARNPDCPLIEVPTPHGELIDRDVLLRDHVHKDDMMAYCDNFVYETAVEDMPVIIEAEDYEYV